MALSTLAEAGARAGGDPAIIMNLAIARYLAGNAAAARETIEEAVVAYPGNGMLYFISSFLLKEAGNEELAEEHFARASRFGIEVERLSREEPRFWMRIITDWPNEE